MSVDFLCTVQRGGLEMRTELFLPFPEYTHTLLHLSLSLSLSWMEIPRA